MKSFFPAERGRSDFNKISQTRAEWRVDCSDMVEIETRSRIPIWRTFGRIQWPVIPEPRITLQGPATWWIQCHDPRATCHIAWWKNFIRHTENRFSQYLIFFLNAVLVFGEWRLSYRLRYTCLLLASIRFQFMIPQLGMSSTGTIYSLEYLNYSSRLKFRNYFNTKQNLRCWHLKICFKKLRRETETVSAQKCLAVCMCSVEICTC